METFAWVEENKEGGKKKELMMFSMKLGTKSYYRGLTIQT